MQLGAGRLRERVVGGVADQEMPETEAVLAGSCGSVGADQLLSHERRQPRRDLRLLRASACTAPRWKSSPSTAPRSSTRRSAASSWSRRAASSARKRRRHLDSSVSGPWRPSRSGTAGCHPPPRDPLAQPVRNVVADQLVGLGRQRLQPQRHRPAGTPLEQLRTRHADEQERRPGESSATCSTRSRMSPRPSGVVEQHDQRRLLLEQLPKRPGDLLCRRRYDRVSPSSDRIAPPPPDPTGAPPAASPPPPPASK